MPNSTVDSLVSASSAQSLEDGSELSFEEMSAMEIATVPGGLPGWPKPHPTLFCHEDMITIEVQSVLFRRPSYFFTQSSSHFAKCLKPGMTNFSILDEDVTADAFANLVRVLNPPLGVTHITHLSEWTDVLRLSSKWEFNDLRSATIKAMRPLASCVDRIALARTYEIAEWLPDAFEEVLAREEDLMVDEAKRIPLEDIVAIARGRREVRETRLMLPQHQVKAIVRNLLGLAPITTVRSSSIALAGKLERTTSPDALHKSDTGTAAERKMVTRWFSQHEDPASSHAAEMCLIEYTRQHAWSVPMIWGHFFSRGLQTFAHAYHDNVASFMRLAFNDAQFHYPASLVASDPSLRFLITLGQDVGLGWAKIFSKTYGDIWKMIQTLSSHDQQESATLCGFIITHTRFIDYLITQGVATTNGHRDFWRGMTYVFSVSSLSTNIVHTAQSLLKELGPCVCTLSSSLEMDEFYRAVEWNRTEAQKAGLVELGGSLKLILQERHWPEPASSRTGNHD